MAKTMEAIDRDYSDAVERANGWKDHDPERYRQLLSDAEAARSSGFRAFAEEQAATARTATLASAKSDLVRKYPLADPSAISGSTPEEMEASAKKSHEFVDTQVQAAQKATQAARRVTTRESWTGAGQTGRVGLPGGETVAQPTATEEQLQGAYNRTAEIIDQSRLPGHLRRYSPENTQAVPAAADPEMAAWSDYKKMHANSGLTFEAFRARNAGKGSFTEGQQNVPDTEDAKG